jgi:type IV secretory pathway VirB10-like protein
MIHDEEPIEGHEHIRDPVVSDSPWDEPKLSAPEPLDLADPPLTRIRRGWVIGIVAGMAILGVGSVVYAMAHRTHRTSEEKSLQPRPYGNATAREPTWVRQLELATTPAETRADVPDRAAPSAGPVSSLAEAAAARQEEEEYNANATEDEDKAKRSSAGYEPPEKYAANTSRPEKAQARTQADDAEREADLPTQHPFKNGEHGAGQGLSAPSLPLGLPAGGSEQLGKLAAALAAQSAQGGDDDDKKDQFMAKVGIGPDIEGGTDIGECEIAAGTPVHVSVMNAINTDLPAQGVITARVVQTVYCGADRQHVAIPQGATFSASADSRVTYGQDRILLCVERLRLPPSAGHPNGTKVDTGCMTVADITGQVGMPAEVDNHWIQLINGALLSTVLSLGASASMGNQQGFAPNLAQNAAHGAGANISQVGQRIVQRDLQRKPTLRTDQLEFSVVLFNRDAQLEPWLPRARR